MTNVDEYMIQFVLTVRLVNAGFNIRERIYSLYDPVAMKTTFWQREDARAGVPNPNT